MIVDILRIFLYLLNPDPEIRILMLWLWLLWLIKSHWNRGGISVLSLQDVLFFCYLAEFILSLINERSQDYPINHHYQTHFWHHPAEFSKATLKCFDGKIFKEKSIDELDTRLKKPFVFHVNLANFQVWIWENECLERHRPVVGCSSSFYKRMSLILETLQSAISTLTGSHQRPLR